MTGGAGSDSFLFGSDSDSATGLGRDLITDFTRGSDLIDLSALNAAKFVGIAAFSGEAAQVRYASVDGATIVELDSNGDRIADLQIELQGQVDLAFADFLGLEIDGTAKTGGGMGGVHGPKVMVAAGGEQSWAPDHSTFDQHEVQYSYDYI